MDPMDSNDDYIVELRPSAAFSTAEDAHKSLSYSLLGREGRVRYNQVDKRYHLTALFNFLGFTVLVVSVAAWASPSGAIPDCVYYSSVVGASASIFGLLH